MTVDLYKVEEVPSTTSKNLAAVHLNVILQFVLYIFHKNNGNEKN